MELGIGDRLYVDNHFCTIRYIGNVRQWGDVKAFGVEWDDASRGKHSGTVDGVKYFETKVDNAGSLLRGAKVARANSIRNSYVEALTRVYLSGKTDSTEVFFGSKKVEMLGLDVLSMRNQDIRHLKIVNLSAKGISTSGKEQELSAISKNLRSLKDLDLSHNLFTDFKEVLCIARGLKSLKTLNISGNRFSNFDSGFKSDLSSVEELIADDCRIFENFMTILSSVFPNLKKLSVNGAQDSLSFRKDTILSSLEEISIARLGLKQFPIDILASDIKAVNYSSNLLTEPLALESASLKVLDISHCQVSSWATVDDLCIKLPNLKSLRINGNPIMADEEEDGTLQVIGRMRNLEFLNGTFIERNKRSDAELYFLSLVARKRTHIDENTPQWRYLVKRHGEIRRPAKIASSVPGVEILVLLVALDEHRIQEMSVLPCYSVRYLKSIISKKISLSIFDFELRFTSKNGGIPQKFNFEFSPISSYDLEDHDTIHVIKKET
ncbi:LAFA_0D08394g1_1 [Lachancea sp. 'fantastica']|nr:LAFA_0D08394g1_1 [Lachancea sp. 'fantastica']